MAVGALAYMWLFSEILRDFPHPVLLLHMERTAALTVAAVEAGGGVEGEVEIVVTGELVADAGEVVVFVDEADVQAGGAGLAVVTVDAHAFGVAGRETAYHRIVQILRRGVHVVEYGLEVRHVPVSTAGRSRAYWKH